MKKVAIIGLSGFAHYHYQELMRLAGEGRVKIVAATVINPHEEADKCESLRNLGCEIFPDYQRMLKKHAGRLDLCVIPTGIHLHAPMTIAALAAGCNVLVEKPAAATTEEIRRMKRASLKANRFVAVGYQHLYAPEIADVKRRLIEGEIGRVQMIKCVGLWARSSEYYSRNNWAGRIKVGEFFVLDAPFNNAFSHWLNLLCFFAGDEVYRSGHPVSVQAELYRTREIESADTACLRIETGEGIPLLFYVTHSCDRDLGPCLEVRGSTGILVCGPDEITISRKGGTVFRSKVSTSGEYRSHMYDAVLERIENPNIFVCGLELAGRQTECSEAAFASSIIKTIQSHGLLRENSAIENIEDIFQEAFENELLLSELDLPWGSPGRLVHIQV